MKQNYVSTEQVYNEISGTKEIGKNKQTAKKIFIF